MEQKELHWKFDVSTFRLLGRELITDRITAIVELVKNAYDANATKVDIIFSDTQKKGGCITIEDNGTGMSSNDIEYKWMRIGTNSKRKEKISPAPFKRRVVGEKGVGRFAIDKLGGYCIISTKTKNDSLINELVIDWQQYDSEYKKSSIPDEAEVSFAEVSFTEINNLLKQKSCNNFQHHHGTKILIEKAHDEWTKEDIKRVYKELSKLISPLSIPSNPFDIYITCKHIPEFTNKQVKNDSIKFASKEFKIGFDKTHNKQEVIKFNNKTMSLDIVYKEINSFGPVTFQLYYFNQYAKANFTKTYKGQEIFIDGIKVYRDGILATPFSQYETNHNYRRDVLEIDKRRWSGFFDKVGTRDLIGIIEISKDLNPEIIDSTNRQDFIENEEYLNFKKFILDQIIQLELLLKEEKNAKRKIASDEINDAILTFNNFKYDLSKIKKDLEENKTDNAKESFKAIEQGAKKIEQSLKDTIKTQKRFEEESQRREQLLLSLMSLQTYAMEIVHIVKTSLGLIKRSADFIQRYIKEEKHIQNNIEYSKKIVNEIDKINSAIDFMSSYTKSGDNWESFEFNASISYVFYGFLSIFSEKKIDYQLEIESMVTISYNKAIFEDIIKNLINNSIKALSSKKTEKKIKCIGYSENDKFIIIFSDNGIGIDDNSKEQIFEPYFTTTELEGGNGLGLYIVKTTMNAIKGSIQLIDSEYQPGATFKLEFPYKK